MNRIMIVRYIVRYLTGVGSIIHASTCLMAILIYSPAFTTIFK